MRKIIVCDFDGTLITKNSFPLWIRFLLDESIKNQEVILFIKLLLLLIKRKVFRKTHADFKKALLLLKFPDEYNERFAETLKKYINKDLVSILNKQSDSSIVISTAAPIAYAKHLERILPFNVENIFYSEVVNGSLIENYSDYKVKNLVDYYGNGFEFSAYSDHYEDAPLLLFAKHAYLVEPSQETLDVLNKLNFKYKII
jgi:phosphoserine phosphatase